VAGGAGWNLEEEVATTLMCAVCWLPYTMFGNVRRMW